MSSRPELKIDDEGGFIRFFRNLTSEPNGAVRIFDRGDYLTAHGEDASLIARTVYKTTSVLRYLGKDDATGLPSVTMTTTVFKNFLREVLLNLGRRVEIWTSQGRNSWVISKKASPGNLQEIEEEIGSYYNSAPILIAVKISAKASEIRTVGVCFADTSVQELGVSEFLDNDLYSNLESLLIQLGVKECLIQTEKSDKEVEMKKLKSILDKCGISLSERPSSDFSIKDIEQDLSRLVRDNNFAGILPQTDLKLAMGSAAALIKYLEVLHDPSNFGKFRIYQHDLCQYMKLDASALKALTLMPGPRDGSKTMSLYGLLNQCKTPVGSRLLAQWLKQPLMDKEEIETRQQLVEAFVEDSELRQIIQEEHMRSIPDLHRLSRKFQRKKAGLEDVVRLWQVVAALPGFVNTLEGVMDDKYKDHLDVAYTNKIKEYLNSLEKFQEMVEMTVDLDAAQNNEYVIKPEFDEKLQLIRKSLEKLRFNMEQEHKAAGKDLNQDIEKKLFLDNHKIHGWCLRLTRAEAGCIRNNKKYQECSTQKNGVYFTTQKLQSLRREFDQLSENYNRTQSSLVNEVINVSASYCPVIELLAGVLAHMDVIISFAHCSVHAPISYIRPKIHTRGTGNTILKEARHPCLEMQDDIQFITNDVTLKRESSEFLIITGPNMGGKSTYIRQIGVIALMAQVGCFVPCTEAELTIFDCILARVGASDSQLKGVSTFMAEMLETANILKSATSESLIIIDELGRGTSTYDGFGLAWAISEYIVREIGCFSMFATHFHELTALSENFPQVKNLHVVAHINTANEQKQAKREVTLLYKVSDGVCDQSFGIHVAELVRFPEKVVNMARRKADELENFTGKQDTAIALCSESDVETGSQLLKEVLSQWKSDCEVQGANLGKEEKVQRLKDLVQTNKQLLANPFFKSVTAL
ncbi:DNA mismatch repair protein msh-2 [Golovinomyces cichoracearum]|uniref:DNA mismatch repair protein msh-2 n=1 Tax=Golovinomyces cichoracearum TaxID=62708 RepID=A0A420IQC4_9PEZI|nr:DNA mismatch repair protein msh-2 [Golovinomyces cichoracearum]